MTNKKYLLILSILLVFMLSIEISDAGGASTYNWGGQEENFRIYENDWSSLHVGTLVCQANLTNTIGDTCPCSGDLTAGTEYYIEIHLNETSGNAGEWEEASGDDWIKLYNFKGGWGGTNPTGSNGPVTHADWDVGGDDDFETHGTDYWAASWDGNNLYYMIDGSDAKVSLDLDHDVGGGGQWMVMRVTLDSNAASSSTSYLMSRDEADIEQQSCKIGISVTALDNDAPEVYNNTFIIEGHYYPIYDGDTYNKYNYIKGPLDGEFVRLFVYTDNTAVALNFTVSENGTTPTNWTAKHTENTDWWNDSYCPSSGNFSVSWITGIDDAGNENKTTIEINGSHYWICDNDVPLVDNMSVNETSVNADDKICINASITDIWGITDVMWAEVTYPNDTVRNETLTDTGGGEHCGDTVDDGWYGVILNVSDSVNGGIFTFNYTFGNDTAGNPYSKEDTSQSVTVPDYDAPNVRNYTFELNASMYDGDTYNKYNYWPSGSLVRMNITVDDDAGSVSGVNFTISDMKKGAAPLNYTGKNDVADEWYNISDCSASGNFTINLTAGIDDSGNENQTGIEINGSHYWICDIDIPILDNMSANETSITIYDKVCINASVTDIWGIIDEFLAEVTYPNDTIRNETLTDGGGGDHCGNTVDDGWYGVILNVSDSVNGGIFSFNYTFSNDTAGNPTTLSQRQTVTVTVPDYDEPEVQNWTFELNASVYDGDTYNKYNYWPSTSNIRMNITVIDDVGTVSGVNFTITDVKNNPDTPINYTATSGAGDEWFLSQICESSNNFSINYTAGIDDSGNENQTGIEINGSHYWICDIDIPVIGNMSINESDLGGYILKSNDQICINASVNDVWGIIDEVLATVTFPNDTFRNESLTDTGGGAHCGNTVDDGWYGTIITVNGVSGNFTFNFSYVNDTAGNLYRNESVDAEINVSIQESNPPEVRNWTFELNASMYDGNTYNKYNYLPSGSLVRMNVTISDISGIQAANFTITDIKNDPATPINYTGDAGAGEEWYNISDCSISANYSVSLVSGMDIYDNENQTGIKVNGSHYWICDIDIPIVDNMSVNETSVLTGDIVCINASISDAWGIPDRMFAEVSYTNGTVRNESMTDDGTHPSCDDVADDGWYGALVNVSDVGGIFAFNFTFGNDTADNRYYKEDTTQTVTVTVPDYDEPNVRNYTFELNASVYDGDTYNKYNYWPSGSLVRMNITVDDDANSVSGVNFTVTDVKNPGAPINYTGKNDVADEWYNISDCSASGNFTVNWTAGIDDEGNENQTGIEINGSHYWICDLDTPTVDNMSVNESNIGVSDKVCINASITDPWGIPDRMFAEVTYPNNTVRNETLTDTGGGANCGTDANDGWYGVILNVSDSSTEGTFTFNFTFGNDTADNRYSKEDTSLDVTVSTPMVYGYLNVTLDTPTGAGNQQPQNYSFLMTANITCYGEAGATCEKVDGTIRYNSTAILNTAIQGGDVFATPFYVVESNPQTCGVMTIANGTCNLTWEVNTTGEYGEAYVLDVNFTSNDTNLDTDSNATENTTITILSPVLSITLSDDFNNISFGSFIGPGTDNNEAINNTDQGYNVTCDYNFGDCNITIQGTDDFVYNINEFDVGNVSWNTENNDATEKQLNDTFEEINNALPDGSIQDIYFWLDIPEGQIPGYYNGNLTIKGEAA